MAATDAAAENARRQKTVSAALDSLIGSSDLMTTIRYSVSIDERFDAGQRIVKGYIARNTVSLETRSIDRGGALVDAALTNGANVVSSLRFWSSSVDQARRESLTAAVSGARADAAVDGECCRWLLRDSLGAALSRFTDSADVGAFPFNACCFTRDTRIPSGLVVTARVTARWSLVSSRR